MTFAVCAKLAINGGPKTVTLDRNERWKQVTEREIEAVNTLMRDGIVTIGNGSGVVGEFEEAFAKAHGNKYALAMNSGTATLHSAYFALGVGPGTEVIVPSYTWHATITPIIHCGATPVFCEIDPNSLTAAPEDIEKRITSKTKVIAVVHTFGNVARMDAIMEIARRHNLKVVEDCSHAHGASYQGRPVGSWGDIGCFSMQGGKAVSGGESGVAVTNDPELFDRMLLLGHFGRIVGGSNTGMFNHLGDMSLGTKYRPHPWAIAMAKVQLERLPELNEGRRKNYALLNRELNDVAGIRTIEPLPGAERAAFLEFKFIYEPSQVGDVPRASFAEAVAAEGAPMTVDRYSDFNYTYGLLHFAPLFNEFDRRTLGGVFYDYTVNGGAPTPKSSPGQYPVTEDVCQRILSLPAFTDVDEEYILQCAAAVRKVSENIDELKASLESKASEAS